MIENIELLGHISEYFEIIKNTLPCNSVFKSANKYIVDKSARHNNTSDLPISTDDKITIFYEYGIDKRNRFVIKATSLISYLRNKKIEQLGI
jgi:hypothetical protein